MDKNLIPHKIVRCKRRSIALIINREGELVVRCPLKAKDADIWQFIEEKKQWITRKKQEILSSIVKNELKLENNKTISILGVNYNVLMCDNCRTARLNNEQVIIPSNNAKQAFISLLKRKLKQYLNKG